MDYDTCYILAAYSASMGQRGTTKADLQSKLNAVTDQMYTVTYEVKSTQVPVENEGGDGETQETVQYVACTIHPFDQSIILRPLTWTWMLHTISSRSPMGMRSSICLMR